MDNEADIVNNDNTPLPWFDNFENKFKVKGTRHAARLMSFPSLVL